MTPAEIARNNAISMEVKKNSLHQMQNGDWRVSFTVQGTDMDYRLIGAAMGTRFMAVLVEIGDDELPVQHQPAKETKKTSGEPRPPAPRAVAKRDWRDLSPAEQAGMRCAQAPFRAFMSEECGFTTDDPDSAAVVVRQLCRVESRRELNTSKDARLRWQSLDDQFQAWNAMERA